MGKMRGVVRRQHQLCDPQIKWKPQLMEVYCQQACYIRVGPWGTQAHTHTHTE